MPLTQITSGGIQDGTITNDDISASATIDATKITGLDKISEGNTEAEVVDTGSNGHFKVTTEGAERLRVDSSGRCGIGTSSPQKRLHVVGDDGAVGSFPTLGAKDFLVVENNGNVNLSLVGGATSGSTLKFFASGNSTPVSQVVSDFANGNLGLTSTTSINFSTASTERVRIDSSGRLLVGTSSAQGLGRIQVEGDADGAKLYLRRNITNSAMTTSGQVVLGSIDFGNIDGAVGARIQANNDTDSGWANNDYPTRLSFSTTADSASSPSERFRIANNGAWGLAGANYGSSGQVLTSNGSGSAPTWATPAGGLGSTTQTWTNVLSSRTNGTTYTNSTGLPIMLSFAGTDLPNQGLNFSFQVQGSNVGVALTNVAPGYSMIVGVYVVPNGHTYRAAWNGAANLAQWWELR